MQTTKVKKISVKKTIEALPDLKILPISHLARLIQKHWAKVYFGAAPYIQAMASMQDGKPYLVESYSTIISRFLSNAGYWRGEIAKQIKTELIRRGNKGNI